ncbi:hypothetical protein CDO52_02675 [Nocardiopsis gilva YIM 90087]|uniref:Uncharacterized protein n=2 Tax=Nocardiopsis gilva TaxID=280236 RepID=A0A223S131_9ACTN|nr:hypothetical protein [Nocardiopsis gilva]ASU81835.1 hypothetical protein CDO52_02675 [Nocardiopsis gilva YIM 90087]
MYSLIWRILPGPRPVKLVLALGLVAGAVALLWFTVFPWADPYLPFNESTLAVDQSEG